MKIIRLSAIISFLAITLFCHSKDFEGSFSPDYVFTCNGSIHLTGDNTELPGKPTHIHLSLEDSESEQLTGMHVTWITDTFCPDQVVQFGLDNQLTNNSGSSSVSASYGFIYKAVLAELLPSSRYFYRVGSDKTGWSQVYSFLTAPLAGSTAPFTVAIFGDTQDNEFNTEFEKTTAIIESLAGYNANFSLHYGDMVVNGSSVNSWLNFLKASQPLIANSPMMMTLGNHDIINADNETFQQPYPIFYDLFPMPGNGLDYSFTYGNALFVCLYAGHAGKAEALGLVRYGPGSPERKWLEEELSRAKRNPDIDWIIAYMHYPVYSYGASNIAGWQVNIAPIFDTYGVDLSLAGHRHAYERHHPVINGKPAKDTKGTVYITNGTSGGSPQGTGGFDLPTMAFTITERMYNYATMTISGKKLEYNVYDINDVLIDNFILNK